MRRFFLLMPLLLVGCGESSTTAPAGGEPARNSAGTVQVHFTTPERAPSDSEIVRALLGHIDAAKVTLDVAAFELDNRAVTDALVRAVQRGVRVRLVTETNYLGESGVTALRAVGVGVVDDQRDGALMHDKFMVFDGKAVWTGSMNFTENCAYRNNNHGLFIPDERVAASYATKFGWMFEQHKFGGLPSRADAIPHHEVTLADGTPLEIYFSTHDHIADRLTAKLREAKKSIHFLAFSFTHNGMAQAMRDRAAAGVEVKGVFEKSQTTGGYSQFGKLNGLPGCEVNLDANPRNMHHKVLILDEETVVAGSFNFSDSADKQNDENVVIFRSRSIARQFEEEFQRIAGAARKASAPLARVR